MARPHWLLALGLMLTLLAPNPVSMAATARDVVLLLDNSGSMRQNDPEFLTRRAVTEFLDGLTEHTRIAIVVFDQKVRMAAPLTPITEATRDGLLEKLAIIDYRGRFTNSPAGMERAIYELKRHGRADAEKTVIFMTDGIVDTGDPTRDRELAKWMRESLAAEAAAAGIRIFGIAFTDAADFQLIQTLTFTTGGTYFRAIGADDIGTVFERIDASLQLAEARTLRSRPSHSKPSQPEPSLPAATAEPADPTTSVLSQPVTVPPPVEMLKAQTPVSSPASEHPTTGARKPVLELEKGPKQASAAASSEHPTPKVPAPSTEKSMSEWRVTPAILVLIGCGLVLLTLGIAVLVRRHSRRLVAVTTPAGGAPTTTRYPPPFCLLQDLSGATHRESHDITGRLTRISRASGEDSPSVRTLVIKDDYISREHAVIEYRDYGYWIRDRGSVNGSFVNDERVASERLLKHGDRLRFHTYEFEVILPEMEGEAKTQQAQIPPTEDRPVVAGEEETLLIGIQEPHETVPNRGSQENVPQVAVRTSSSDPSTRASEE